MRKCRMLMLLAVVFMAGMLAGTVRVNAEDVVTSTDNVVYIDEQGEEQTAEAIDVSGAPVDGDKIVLGQEGSTSWYYVSDDFKPEKDLVLKGDVNIILTDGSLADLEGKNINGTNDAAKLHIYGQTEGIGTLTAKMIDDNIGGLSFCGGIINLEKIYSRRATAQVIAGTVNVDSEDGQPIQVTSLDVSGGKLDVKCKTVLSVLHGTDEESYFLSADGIAATDIKITGGSVSSHVKVTEEPVNVIGISILAMKSTYGMRISGGNVEAVINGFDQSNYPAARDVGVFGMYTGVNENITLGWTKPSDSITATSYYGKVVIENDDSLFTDEKMYEGELSDEQVAEIAGKTLTPAIDKVTYIDEHGAEQTAEAIDVSRLPVDVDKLVLGKDEKTTWYYVSGDFKPEKDIVVRGDVNIVLTDGSHADFEGRNINGTSVADKLHVYGQTEGSGKLTAKMIGDDIGGLSFCGGIINLNKIYSRRATAQVIAGTVSVDSEDDQSIQVTSLDVSGGTLDAKCNAAFEIIQEPGEEKYILFADGISASNITITGGNVSSHVRVEEDTLNVVEISISAMMASNGIQISGGNVSAVIDEFDQSRYPAANHVELLGMYSSNITLGWTNRSDSIKATSYHDNVIIENGDSLYADGKVYEGELSAEQIAEIAGKTLTPASNPVTYIDEHGEEQTAEAIDVSGVPVDGDKIVLGQEGSTSWYYVSDDFKPEKDLVLRGDVNIILTDGSLADLEGRNINGTNDAAKLHIYGQTEGTGTLTAKMIDDNIGGLSFCGGIINLEKIYSRRATAQVIAGTVNVDTEDDQPLQVTSLDVSGGTLDVKCNAAFHKADGTDEDIYLLSADGIVTNNIKITGGNVSSHVSVTEKTVNVVQISIVAMKASNGIQISGGNVAAVIAEFDQSKYPAATDVELVGMLTGKDSNITLGWTKPSDSITATSYYGNVVIEDSKQLTDGENTYEGVLNEEQIDAIKGKMLTPGTGTHVHHVTKVEAKPADCENAGNIEYYLCDQGEDPCGCYFKEDPEGTITINYNDDEITVKEIGLEDTVVPALGHEFGTVDYTWEDDYSAAEAKRRCTKCGEVATERVATTVQVNKGATCQERGTTIYTAEFKSKGLETKTREVPNEEYGDHKWDEGKVTTPATETAEGVKIYTCTVCGETKTEAIPKTEPTPEPAPGSDPNQKGKDGTAVGPGASAAAADRAITHLPNDNDPAGSVYGKLQAKSTKQTKNSVNVKWNKVKGATKYVIYGNACGNKIKMKKLATSTGKAMTFKKIADKKVKKGTYYKFIIVALDKNNNVVSTSKIVHVATKGGKVGNHKSVTVKKSVLKKAKKLKKDKSLKLKAKAVKASKLKVKKHVAVRYESSNPKIATVSKKGVVKAKGKGSCYIYAYAQNGVAKKIKVTVR